MPGFEPLSVIGTGAKIETSNWEKIRASVGLFVPDILETEQRYVNFVQRSSDSSHFPKELLNWNSNIRSLL